MPFVQCVAFDDISPQAPVHFLVIPRKPLPSLSASEDTDEQVNCYIMYIHVHVYMCVSSYGSLVEQSSASTTCQSTKITMLAFLLA